MSTPIGIVIALVGVLGAMVMEGSSPAALVSNPAALVLVILGTLGASIASVNMSDVGVGFKGAIKAMKGGKSDSAAIVDELVGFADTARREGLLALEEKVKAVEDEFLKRALEQVIDGSDPEAVEDTLYAEVDAMKKRHAVAQKFWGDAGAYAPTIGIIGTVIGLMHVMTELQHPEKLGPLIAGAFLATLWALLFANLFFMPIAAHLKRKTADEVAQKELIIQGVLSIQSGASPRALGDRLKSSLAPKVRETVGGKGDKQAA
ncbi:MAG: chemotaxis protein MotA [Frankiaceae bacterium]|nr:chemotaxis protein MotA [Frankiaceae bacterium]